ncbi:MAG: CxxxxCH/CxxCH domain-containing protein [Ignavibacteriaceae bacterium]
MKKTLLIYLLLILPALFLLSSCSKESSELTTPETLGIHQPGVLDSTSSNFHGKFFVQKNMKFTDCQKCHGKTLDGGVTNAKACSECHALATIHLNLTGVQDSTSSNFHGRYLLQHSLSDCAQCHGHNFAGGSSSPSCIKCHDAISVHKPALLDSTSADFHGKFVLKNKFTQCQSCHGQNFAGGISSPSCATCHQSIDVHKDGIADSTDVNSPNFHGKYKLKDGLADCSQCHGTSFTGGTQSPSCTTCHSTIDVHKSGIIDPSSPNFHGKYPLKNGFTDCKTCHGDNFAGGNNSVACTTCHSTITVHKDGIVTPSSPNFHGNFLKANGWNINACASCHSSNFSGGTQSPSCKTSGCHTSAQGPAACNTCHGDFNNPSQIAPPKDLDGNTVSTSPGVGAHTKHLAAFANGGSLACSECHTVPSDVNSAGHLGSDGKAEINFGTFSNKLGGSSYDFTTNKCANTYCHGNFEFKKSDASSSTAQLQYTSDKMVGNNRSPVWTNSSGSETKCSSCHGIDDAHPSPIGHIPYTIDQCVWCHSGVVDASGTILDPTKHINGKVNAFGTKARK